MPVVRFVAMVFAALALTFAPPAAAKDPLPGLFIKPGESFIFKLENGQPVDVRAASDGEEPGEGELKASFTGGGMARLSVRNNTGEMLNYEAYITAKPDKKGQRTSVCTLISGGSGFESWPGNLPGLRLTNLKPAGGSFGCF